MESLAGTLLGQVVNSVNEQLQTLPVFDKEYKDKYVQFKYPKEYEVEVDELTAGIRIIVAKVKGWRMHIYNFI